MHDAETVHPRTMVGWRPAVFRACGVSRAFERGYFGVPLRFRAADVPRFIPYALYRILLTVYANLCISCGTTNLPSDRGREKTGARDKLGQRDETRQRDRLG